MSDTTENKQPYNPFADKVIQRDYTQDMIKADIGEISEAESMEDIPEPTYDKPNIPKNEPTQDIPSSSSSSYTESTSSFDESESVSQENNYSGGSKKVTPSRKDATRAADALLHTYCEFVPTIFTKISSFNMRKMKNLDKTGEINLNMTTPKSGKKIESVMNDFNNDIQQAYIVSDETKQSIREPLIEVLMEEGITMSPKTQLIMAVGGHLAQLSFISFQIIAAKKDLIEEFKDFKKSDDNNRYVSRFTNQSPPQPPQKEEPIVAQQPPKQEASYDAPLKEENYEKPTFGMDEYINSDIPENDSSIEITEVESEQIH